MTHQKKKKKFKVKIYTKETHLRHNPHLTCHTQLCHEPPLPCLIHLHHNPQISPRCNLTEKNTTTMTLPHRDPPQTGHHFTPREIGSGSGRWRDRVGVRERGLKERERITTHHLHRAWATHHWWESQPITDKLEQPTPEYAHHKRERERGAVV